MRFALALLAATLLAAHPATAKPVKYSARYPAKNVPASQLRTVAVLPFEGQDGAEFTHALTVALESAMLDQQPHFTVKAVDTDLTDTLSSKKGARGGEGDTAKAVRIGRRLGVQGVYLGRVTAADVAGGAYQTQVKTNNEVTSRACLRWIGQYGVLLKLVRVDNGAIVYSDTITQAESFDRCGGDGTFSGSVASAITGAIFKKKSDEANQTPEGMRAKMRADAAAKVRAQVAPFNKELQLEFKRADKDIPKDQRELFGNAIAFADAGRLDRACSMFETMMTDATANNVTLLFNMGGCQEALLPDEPASALQYYAKADQLLSKPDKAISEAYLRLKGMVSASRSIGR